MDNSKQIKRQNEFIAEKYDRFTMTFPKGRKEVYREHAEAQGMSLNAYINALIIADMEQDKHGTQTEHQTEHQTENTAKPHNTEGYTVIIPKEKVRLYKEYVKNNPYESIEEWIFDNCDADVEWEVKNGYIK